MKSIYYIKGILTANAKAIKSLINIIACKLGIFLFYSDYEGLPIDAYKFYK